MLSVGFETVIGFDGAAAGVAVDAVLSFFSCFVAVAVVFVGSEVIGGKGTGIIESDCEEGALLEEELEILTGFWVGGLTSVISTSTENESLQFLQTK